MMNPPVLCLMGPTASGKTQLAIALVQRFPCEIISVDSAMVYRDMNIGTAKPDAATLQIAPHRLIDIRDPADAYSAARFRVDALHEIEKIIAAQKIPLLVGGTMLYFRALQQGLATLPSADQEVRTALTREAEQIGWPALHQRLVQIDALAAQRIHPHDSQRIQRALEVHQVSGKSLTAWQQESGTALAGYTLHQIAIAPTDRAVLHERIALRFQQMLAQGFIEEVEHLRARGDLNLATPAMRSVGYRQVWEYLAGQLNFAGMQERGIIATRQLAKRQLTWLRSWPHLTWLDSEAPDVTEQAIRYCEKYIFQS